MGMRDQHMVDPGLGIEREHSGNRTGVEQQVAVNKEADLIASWRLPTNTPRHAVA